jgi:hydrogenase maturation protease
MSSPTPLLVLGLGNVLLQDDGVGPNAVALLLDRYEAPAGVSVLDGGTLGLSLLPYVEDAKRVILVDAVRTDAPAGALVRLDGRDVLPAVATRLSPHQVGVLDLLDGARFRDRFPSYVALIGIVPDAFDLSMTLTPPVAAALPALVEAIVDDARRLGFRFARRPTRVWRHGAGPVDGVQADGMLESMAIGSREGLDATISAPTGKRR